MTVSTTMISQVSPYSVSDSGEFTTTLFNFYSPVAKKMLDLMCPTLASEIYDYCHALLICHLYEAKGGDIDKMSMSIAGDFSFTRNLGDTAYLVQCRATIALFQDGSTGITTLKPTESAGRADASETGIAGLDRYPTPSFGE